MRKRYVKSILVGTFAVVLSAIVVGPADGGSFVPNYPQRQGPPQSQQVHQPGVTSGYAALPPEVMKTPDEAQTSFVPGHTDFPNTFRSNNAPASVAATSSISSSGGSDFSWSDAGVGIGIGLAITGGLVFVAFVGIRRNRATPVPA